MKLTTLQAKVQSERTITPATDVLSERTGTPAADVLSERTGTPAADVLSERTGTSAGCQNGCSKCSVQTPSLCDDGAA